MALENSIFSTLFPAMDARQKSLRPLAMRSAMGVTDMSAMQPAMGDAMPHDTASVMGVEDAQVDPTGMMPQPSVEEITAAINAPLMYGTEDVTETVSTPTDTSSIQGTVTDPNAYKPLYDAPQNEYESSQEALRKNLYDIQNPQNKDKGVKGFLKEGLENFLFGLSHAKDGMGFWESMALGGSGFGMGIANRGANEKRAALRNTPLLQEAVKQAEGRQRLQMQQEQYKRIADNQIRDDQDRVVARNERLKSTALGKLVGLKHFDPKDTVHSAYAKSAGLDPTELTGWDDRKKDMKQVAGIWYRDDGKGNFAQTNIPADETKTVVDYVVEMPPDALGRREKRTYKVAQKDAANFSTQMSALGARLAQSESQFVRKMDADNAKTQALNTYRNASLDLRKQALALRQAGDARGAEKLEQQSQALRAKLIERVRENKLTQEDFDEIFGEDEDGATMGGVGIIEP